MNKLSYYETKTFKELCSAAKFKGFNLRECGLGDGETCAYVVTFDDGHFIAISIMAYECRNSPNDSENLELNFHVNMDNAARTFKKNLNYYYVGF